MQASPSPEIEERRQGLAQSIKLRLAADAISPTDARDGLRDCFIASYLGGVSQGFRNFEIQGDVNQVSQVIDGMFRQKLKARGSSWEHPNTEALYQVKEQLDREIHLHELPVELRSVHDQVCNLLLSKASAQLPHRGDRSVVTKDAPIRQSPVEHSVRRSVIAYLKQIAIAVDKGIAAERLLEDVEGLKHLLEGLRTTTRPAG